MPDLLATVQHEVDRLASHALADAVIVTDGHGLVLASAGPARNAWAGGHQIDDRSDAADSALMLLTPSEAYRTVTQPLESKGKVVGRLLLAWAINDAYAARLSTVSHAPIAVVVNGRVTATTLSAVERHALDAVATDLPDQGTVKLDAETEAVRLLFKVGEARFSAIDAITAATAAATRSTSQALFAIALGALGLGAIVSLWLALNVSRPIDHLSYRLREMAGAHDFSQTLPPPDTSLELNALTETFNALMSSLATAEQATEAAYLAAIKALAAALDARDPYTAGHSERVSALSVMIGRWLALPQSEIEVLRLGALLHDIGKIGIRDKVLAKVGPLTDEEFEIIKTHPTVGARILREVPFLSAHVPIVELHHEQPDGGGYPHGLTGELTPLLARIVHVADAFDAMTSARAYRAAQDEPHALGELHRYRGTRFDTEVVDAFVTAWDTDVSPDILAIQAAVRDPVPLFKRASGL